MSENEKPIQEPDPYDVRQDKIMFDAISAGLELGHLLKYNIYLNAKATVFAAVIRKLPYNEDVFNQAVTITGQVMQTFGEQDHPKTEEKE